MNSAYQLLSISISKEVNRIPIAKIEILDGDPTTNDFVISDSSDFVPGNTIEIKSGYEATDESIFSGIIIKHGLKVRPGKAAILSVECRDKSIKMTVGRKNAYYSNTTDSDLIGKIIGTYGLSKTVDATSNQLKEVVQYYSTDWDFIVSRAEINGLVVLVDANKITVQKPDTSKQAVLELEYGDSVLGFEGEMDARTQLSSVQCTSWDSSSQAVKQVTSQPQSVSLPGNLSSSTLADVIGLSTFQLQTAGADEQGMLQSWANARILKSNLSKIRGTVKFQGSSLVVPGSMIELKGLGGRFNGNAYVSGVEHSIRDGNWITIASLGLSHDWYSEERENIVAPSASGLLPGIKGLYVGTVKQINEDPDGQFRVLVNVPVIKTSGDGIWARLATFYATSGAGNYFFPEKDDEVVLGFFNEDPRFPVILGSLYSSSRTAPFTPDEKNGTKAIVTKNKLKINFDDENKVITVITPGGNQVVLSDQDKSITLKDQNNNKIEMTSGGITLDSASNITIKAAQNIEMTATNNLTVKATNEVNVSGLNITNNAQTQLTVKGGVTAELSSGGEVTVKGAMVMIN